MILIIINFRELMQPLWSETQNKGTQLLRLLAQVYTFNFFLRWTKLYDLAETRIRKTILFPQCELLKAWSTL